MSTGTAQYINLRTTPIQWNSLKEIHDSIQAAQFEVRNRQRYFIIENEEIPVAKVANEIYARRPYLLNASDEYLKLYFDTAKKFSDTLPQEPTENSTLKKMAKCFSDSFWSCYFPIQLCWCTSGCKEKVVIHDSKLGLEGVNAWKEHIEENAAQ